MTPKLDAENIPISVQANPQPIKEKPRVRRAIDEEGDRVTASSPHYLPIWDHSQKYEPLQPFEHIEHGKGADPGFKDLLTEGSKLQHLTPTTGSEVTGVQLSKLSDAGKDQLALLDLTDLPIQDALDFGGYFGRHHIHPTSGSPEGYPELHMVHRNGNSGDLTHYWPNGLPLGTTFLYALDVPQVGGDTAFVNQVEAYNRLSPLLKDRLHGLKAVHSGVEQSEFSRKLGGVVRREPITSEHPIVRTHPATGQKALYVNSVFTRSIVGFKNEESEALLNFLYNHISRGIDYQARVRWAPGTVVIWDNRVASHSAIIDWTTGERRHLARITPRPSRAQTHEARRIFHSTESNFQFPLKMEL
ncbi:alpha-ketoglutarate-dependent taurine dioxygenase [Eremomyces bilateralis CBS 781.70]|uniref:Alpha-ketoglutarate-dependent taurine dioxygenase n=1 Tax=Eremomyces bilateralis CBS 781.70 TaxID=1392243 RepID=A0A6G1G053_9PEZI|nr:alpha-ketoglutarate-dependent taurine dioxygenase [Eremomyces bilateralis CBS 781.70]KAF1811306.1 alpha-ketoglutarate-dependent taurine dioxygenase [Eremomyces bilateralis CBS 781.70]